VSLTADSIGSLTQSKRRRFTKGLSEDKLEALKYDWPFWAREKQLAPAGDWTTWLVMAGRGYGKTKLGAEFVRGEKDAGRAKRIALIGRTAADVRDVMVEGESGILACSPPWDRPKYEPSKRRLTWPNGTVATTYSAKEPDLLRGPQHDLVWADEMAAWEYRDAWTNAQLGLRIGERPRAIVTTTPRPIKAIRELLADPNTVTTRGSTYDNRANLAPAFFDQIIKRYEGTRTGRQELYAELLEEAEGALWKRSELEEGRVKAPPEFIRVVVAIDPAVTSNEESDETGIVVAGLGTDRHGYLLRDLSGRYTPDEWARIASQAHHEHKGDRIIAEVNNGGEMVEFTLRTVDKKLPYLAVHASRGKRTRAEPVGALYEQGRIHHVGAFDDLEDQLCCWEPNGGMPSPDRLDALVWAMTELMLGDAREPGDYGLTI